jgi:hypothetical protein
MKIDEKLRSKPFETATRSNIQEVVLRRARRHKIQIVQSAKYEFASSNTTRTTFAFDACFVWKLAPLADERSGFFIENLSRRLTRSRTY